MQRISQKHFHSWEEYDDIPGLLEEGKDSDGVWYGARAGLYL
jgi:hypothetical protein